MNETQVVIPISFGQVMAFLIKGQRSILVDTGVPGSEAKILQTLAANGVAPQDLALILITHCHSDHFGSLLALKKHTAARVAIHQLEAEMLTQGVNAEICPVGILAHILKFVTRFLPQPKTGVKPDILIERELDLAEFGVQGKVIATPGHTAGSVSVILASGEALIGDLIVGFRKGVPNYPMFARDLEHVKTSLKMVLAYQPKKIYAAHGGLFEAESIVQKFGL